MKTITRKEFTDWIKAQPDDRPVNMLQGYTVENGCGCLMVQYAKELFPEKEVTCGTECILENTPGSPNLIQFEGFVLNDLFKFNGNNRAYFLSSQWKTFGELRKVMCI